MGRGDGVRVMLLKRYRDDGVRSYIKVRDDVVLGRLMDGGLSLETVV